MSSCWTHDILLWKDVRKSAAIFLLSLFILTALSFYSVLTVVTCIAIPFITVMLALRGIWVLKCAFMKEALDNPFQSWLNTDIELNGERISSYNTELLLFVNDIAISCRKIVLVADMLDTAKALGILFALYYLGKNFCGITLLFTSILIAFTVPKILSMYKEDINRLRKVIADKSEDVCKRIKAAIPIGKEKAKSS
eukprot:Seg1828.10 transcript_id=Seg1828.10/GoldUCD/mRNA.D3Y31 product=Reticulon-3 protein_id=Seg1828.10/GoldUCD/D3Y31